jgi:hypothetical protein
MWLIETEIELEVRRYVLDSEDITRHPYGQGKAERFYHTEKPVRKADEVREG